MLVWLKTHKNLEGYDFADGKYAFLQFSHLTQSAVLIKFTIQIKTSILEV